MSATYKGAVLVTADEWNYLQDEGMQHTLRGRGRQANVVGYARAMINQGYDVTISHGPAYWDFTAFKTIPYDYRQQVERWTLTTEILEKDIWSHPQVMAAMYADAAGPASYKKTIQDAVDAGEAISATPSWLVTELSRGVEAYEHEYHVLSRTVTFSMSDVEILPSTFNMTLQLSRQIISSAQMAAVVPPEVLFTLPADQASPTANDASYYQWGWRIREQRCEIDTSTTGTFVESWTYAAWSTFLYTPYTT